MGVAVVDEKPVGFAAIPGLVTENAPPIAVGTRTDGGRPVEPAPQTRDHVFLDVELFEDEVLRVGDIVRVTGQESFWFAERLFRGSPDSEALDFADTIRSELAEQHGVLSKVVSWSGVELSEGSLFGYVVEVEIAGAINVPDALFGEAVVVGATAIAGRTLRVGPVLLASVAVAIASALTAGAIEGTTANVLRAIGEDPPPTTFSEAARTVRAVVLLGLVGLGVYVFSKVTR